MSNFLDLDESESAEPSGSSSLKDLLAGVRASEPRRHLHPEVSDKLASQHGFASREPSDRFFGGGGGVPGRRTVRGVPVEESKQLSIRMPISLYVEFLAYADSAKLTYSEAIRALLDGRYTNERQR